MALYNGVIEGFFGRAWSHSDRLEHIQFLAHNNYNFYIYAPKSDTHLRKSWPSEWPMAEWPQLMALSTRCQALNLDFGIGLSPFELHLDFNAPARTQLQHKIQRINQLKPKILCVLFDDMRGNLADLAKIQTEITTEIMTHCSAQQIIVCPSYYSEDPVLDKVFGPRPKNYLEDLGLRLPAEVDIFWTGKRVCSPSFSNEDIKSITKVLKRKPFLWDNYPVNDGAKLCNHLHLKGFAQRNNLNDRYIAGHAINPMNQAWLSQLSLATLPELYKSNRSVKKETERVIKMLTPTEFAPLQDINKFQSMGRAKMSTEQKLTLISTYRKLPKNPYATEIIDWLEGGYAFDPNCLTD